MDQDEVKKTAINIIIFTILTSLFFYFYVRTGIGFESGFDLNQSMDILNLRSFGNLFISLIFLSVAIFSVIFFSKENNKKERIITIMLGTIIATFISLRYFADPSIFTMMVFFYLIAFAIISLKKHIKAKGVFQKLSIGWGTAKKLIFIIAIGGFITGFVFTHSNLEGYQEVVKDSIIEMSLMGSEELLPEGIELDETAIEQSKLVMESMLEDLTFFQTFLDNLPLLMGIMVGGSILFVGGLIVPPITALFCLFLPTETDPKVKLKEKKGVFSNVNVKE